MTAILSVIIGISFFFKLTRIKISSVFALVLAPSSDLTSDVYGGYESSYDDSGSFYGY